MQIEFNLSLVIYFNFNLDHSWGRTKEEKSDTSPRPLRRKQSGETRLDRLVRRPSGDKGLSRAASDASVPPSLPKPKKLIKKWPNTQLTDNTENESVKEEPLYDTVANDEPEDDYDNHLLYITNKNKKPTDTVR